MRESGGGLGPGPEVAARKPSPTGSPLQPTPTPGLVLLDGYVRVSQIAGRGGERFISPGVQRDQIRSWAKANNAQIGEVFEELDQSGARSDRPLLLTALERVERGESQGIVVAKLDRFGRSLVDGLSKIDRIVAAGGVFVSVQDGLDLSTPTGRLVLRIMFSMAEWELERVRATWATAKARAIDRGVHVSVAPIGYRRGGDGRLVPEEPAASLIAEVFRRRAEGATNASLIALLNSSGLQTGRGSPRFVESSVKGILTNRTYLGEVRSGDFVKTGAHPPLVSEATWQSAQRPQRFESNRRTSLLGGLLRCGSCRMKMSVISGVYRNSGRAGTYRCPCRTSAGECPAPARIRGEEIEHLVEDFFFRSLSRGRQAPASATSRAEADLGRCRQALARYRDVSGALTALSPENFAAGLAKREADIQAAALTLAGAERTSLSSRDPVALERDWPALTVAERRRQIEEEIDCIFVSAEPDSATERCHVCPRGSGPIDAPRRGAPLGEIRPFRADRQRGVVRLRAPRVLSERRVERELKAWRGEETACPSYEEFLRAGRLRLYGQILAWGGIGFWARRMGWSDVPRVTVWSDEAIAAGLRPILRGRDVWPAKTEFRELGLAGLRRAVIRHGGITQWADLSGVALRPGTAAPAGTNMKDTRARPGPT
jgi:DNA invertase Pin-like site-specific DNA recombinase